jgi:hypothetical protein
MILQRLFSQRKRLAEVEKRLDTHIARANLTNRLIAVTVMRIQSDLDKQRRRHDTGR